MLWVPAAAKKIANKAGTTLVALQARGTPAIEFIEPLEELGLTVFQVGGSELGSSAGQFKDHIEAGTVFHRSQPVLDMAVSGGQGRNFCLDVADEVDLQSVSIGVGRQ
ncbi:hypothetical protein ACKLTP_18765, partial [Paenarthrobacter ureafaciens]|uniref:hypothetical protein n=1 Tax=Paenarthrobacter ureafaciens TaxID=37931 RepID=UPI00397E50C4